MAKRIVSGIFVLTALGALGVILAGALTSGEQLIVRFLTAVTVAALGLYVISDLRMQSEESDARRNDDRGRDQDGIRRSQPVASDSTAAYMATVTGRHQAIRVDEDQRELTRPGSTSAPTTTFEATQPVTYQSTPTHRYPEEHIDLTSATSHGSRPQTPMRALPPHPNTVLSRAIPAAGAPTELVGSSLANAVPLTTIVPPPDSQELADSPLASQVPPTGEEIPPAVGPNGPSSIAYSGPLHVTRTDWPPSAGVGTPSAPGDGSRPELSLGSDDEIDADGVDTEDVPVFQTGSGFEDRTLTTVSGDEYGPVTVDELLGELDTDLSAPLTQTETETESEIETETASETETARETDGEQSEIGHRHLTLISSELTSRQIEASHYADPLTGDLIDLRAERSEPSAHPVVAETADGRDDDDRLNTAIQAGEMQVIGTLIQQGMLSTSGPITDRDVRTMVYVAFTSNELRKLIRSGETPDRVRSGDVDLGPVELFDERRYAPLPTRIYDPTGAQRRQITSGAQTSIDLDDDIDLTEHDDERVLPPMPSPKYIYRKPGVDVTAET